jgi:CBS domain-containing protein
MKIQEIMQRDVVTVAPHTSLKDAAALLVRHRISGLPVCAEDGRVVGVISEADIVQKEQTDDFASTAILGRLIDQAYGDADRFAARTVGGAMTSPALTVRSRDEVAHAAHVMITRRVNRLPVVDGARLVGIVTRSDLVRAFDRDDEAILHEIEEEVLRSMLWIDPETLEITVEDGVVTLDGPVETKTIAEIVRACVRRVPGVVDVESHLTWRIDDLLRRRRTLSGRIPRRV